jgi:hypothetical protein
MADVALYFDDSGFGGTAGSEDGWAAVANWQAGLGDGDYPILSHLIENGWEDDLPGLEADIQSALKDDSSALGAGKASLEEFLSVLQDRAEGDKAVAITLNEETEVELTIDEPAPADNAKGGKGMPSKQAEVDPQKACKIIKDGGVHDASGKWRPLTQAQRGMFGALCGQAKGKKPTTHEDMDSLRDAITDVSNSFCATGPGGGINPACSPKSGKPAADVRRNIKKSLVKARSKQQEAGKHGAWAVEHYNHILSHLDEKAHPDLSATVKNLKTMVRTEVFSGAVSKSKEAMTNAYKANLPVDLQSKFHAAHGAILKAAEHTKAAEKLFSAAYRAKAKLRRGKNPTTHEESTEAVDGTPLDESLTVEDIVAMYDANPPAPNETNEEHVLALASVAERINGATRHPETGQFTNPETVKESKFPKAPHLGEHSSTAYEATKRVKPGNGPASDSISYSTAAYGYAVAGDHVSAAKAHRKAATAHSKAYSNLREDNTERALHKAAENLHRAAARAHAAFAGGPAANGEFTDTWADESDPLYGLTPEDVRDSLAELCGRQVTESVRESTVLF